jgi:pimeloyl-ACP methyl ester carboxylesterase
MRATLISTMLATALAFGGAAYGQVTAAASATSAAEATAEIQDGKADVNGVRYHYLLARGGQTVVLLHGWGSTSYMWRFVMPQLVARGYTVLAPDLRGLGDTTKPPTGYEKTVIADDIRALVQTLNLGPTIHLVGHDMGGMVSYAYAAQHPDEIRTLAILDVPLPGIDPWDQIVQTPRTWHFRFYSVQDVPEMLIAGHELEYLKWFHNSEAVNARAYAMPGALRAGFEYYRAFPNDVKANREFAKRKLTMPVLGIGGSGSFGAIIGDHLRHVADNVQAINVEGAGHWVAEEQPAAVANALLKFLPPAR